MKPLRIVIAVPIKENLLGSLYQWGRTFDFSHVESIHFLHVVKQTIMPLEFGLIESPDKETYNDMRPSLRSFLKEQAKQIVPEDFQGSIGLEVTRGLNSEEEVIEVLKVY